MVGVFTRICGGYLSTAHILCPGELPGARWPALSWVKNRGGADRNSFLADVFAVIIHTHKNTHTHTHTDNSYIYHRVGRLYKLG